LLELAYPDLATHPLLKGSNNPLNVTGVHWEIITKYSNKDFVTFQRVRTQLCNNCPWTRYGYQAPQLENTKLQNAKAIFDTVFLESEKRKLQLSAKNTKHYNTLGKQYSTEKAH
jgi:hypothetical protein